MGVDERFKIPVWQFWLVKDLVAFYTFPLGAHVYRHSILSFKHVLPRRREERGQQLQGDVLYTVKRYNIYGMLHALLIFAFEVIPQLGFDFGARRATELSPRMLKWKLTKQPRGKKLAKIFSARKVRRRREEEGGGGRRSDTKASDPSSPSFSAMDTDGSYPSSGRLRHRRVRFTTTGPATSRGDSRAAVGHDVEAPLEHHLSEDDRQRRLSGISTYTYPDGPPGLDPDFTPGDRTCGYFGGTRNTGARQKDPHTEEAVPESEPDQRTRDIGHVSHTVAGSLGKRQLAPLIEQQTPSSVEQPPKLLSPHTDPCRLKRAGIQLEAPEHVFDPHELVDGDQLKAYPAFKKNRNRETFYTLIILYYVYILPAYGRLPPYSSEAPASIPESIQPDDKHLGYTIFCPDTVKHWATTLGNNIGHRHWLLVTIDLTSGKMFIVYPWRQEISVNIQRQQVAPLLWFLPSMLHQADFHTARSPDRETFPKKNRPFSVSVVSTTRVPQQKKFKGNYGPHTLRLIEYILADRKDFDWLEDDMEIIREKMAVEIFSNSRPV
ncbi:hypothetical protein Ddye_009278 [Dipteronia dyeriana]|uniref:Ubiquitin-like protease family profile domain-containing protein n=1 Tax=Dipteronia dyeriana TaxID=168575 RepID=A0AAD9XBQ0_9ROSI|nr:hypothetical protein Ddye_009278 [Dipteronia dyeriana]